MCIACSSNWTLDRKMPWDYFALHFNQLFFYAEAISICRWSNVNATFSKSYILLFSYFSQIFMMPVIFEVIFSFSLSLVFTSSYRKWWSFFLGELEADVESYCCFGHSNLCYCLQEWEKIQSLNICIFPECSHSLAPSLFCCQFIYQLLPLSNWFGFCSFSSWEHFRLPNEMSIFFNKIRLCWRWI